jgi:hypothetical protein
VVAAVVPTPGVTSSLSRPALLILLPLAPAEPRPQLVGPLRSIRAPVLPLAARPVPLGIMALVGPGALLPHQPVMSNTLVVLGLRVALVMVAAVVVLAGPLFLVIRVPSAQVLPLSLAAVPVVTVGQMPTVALQLRVLVVVAAVLNTVPQPLQVALVMLARL